MNFARDAFRAASLAVVAFGLAACNRPWMDVAEYPYSTTASSTDFNEKIMSVYGPITYVVIAVFVVVFAVFFYTIFRFRDDGSPGNPEQVHGNTQLEIGWTLAPVVIVIAITVPTVRTIFEIADAAPEDALEIAVNGKRWWWEFTYIESGVVTANEMHVPAGRPVSLLIQSDSVIHSFWTPRLGGKRDAVPGRINRMWFTVTDDIQPGSPITYRGACAEYCGEAHALMRHRVVGHEEAEFDQWLADMQEPVPARGMALQKGKAVFTSAGCVGCHAITGNEQAAGNKGPDLTRFGDRQMLAADTVPNTPENLKQWIRDPNSIKPGTTATANVSRGGVWANDGMNIPLDKAGGPDGGPDGILSQEELSDEDLDALVAYLMAQKSE